MDELSKLDPLDPKTIVGILVEHMNQPSLTDEFEVIVIDALDWRSPIIDYLKILLANEDSK